MSDRSKLTPRGWKFLRTKTQDVYEYWLENEPEGKFKQHCHTRHLADYCQQHYPKLTRKILSLMRGKVSKSLPSKLGAILFRADRAHPCDVCGNITWGVTCSRSCKKQSKVVKAKTEETCLERYGVTNFALSPELVVRQRAAWNKKLPGVGHGTRTLEGRETCRQNGTIHAEENTRKGQETKRLRYGEDWKKILGDRSTAAGYIDGVPFFASEVGKEKAEQGMLKKYGVRKPLQNSDLLDKRNQTVSYRYGAEPSSLPEFRGRIEATLIKNFGEDYQKAIGKIIKKSALRKHGISAPLVVSNFRLKTFVLNGYSFECYGYEPMAIHWLVKEKKIHLSRIFTTREMLESGSLSIGDRQAYPDIWIDGTKPVEVKSLYTLAITYDKLVALATKYPDYKVLVMTPLKGTDCGIRIPFSRKELLAMNSSEALQCLRAREKMLRDIHRQRKSAHT